ncbi:hypothetical protein JCM9279_006953 [Rhodotorula babjevae]
MGPPSPALRRLSSRSTRNPTEATPLDDIDEAPFSINATPPLRPRLAERGTSTWSDSPPPSSRQSLWGRVLGLKRFGSASRSNKYSGGSSNVNGSSTPTGSFKFPPSSSRPLSSAPTSAAPPSDDEPHLTGFPFPDMASPLASPKLEQSSPHGPAPPRLPRTPILAARPWLEDSTRALTPVSSGSEGTPSSGSTGSEDSSSRSRGSYTPSLPRVQEGVAFGPSPVAVPRPSQQVSSSGKGRPLGRGRSRRRRIETGSGASSSSAGGRDEAAPSTAKASSSSRRLLDSSSSIARRSDSSRSLAELIADDARDYSSSSSDSQRSPGDIAPRISPTPPLDDNKSLVKPARAPSGSSSSGSGSEWPPRGLTSRFSDWTPSPDSSSRNASGSRGRSSFDRPPEPSSDDLFGAVPAVLERGPHPRRAAHASQAPTTLVVEDKVDKVPPSLSSSSRSAEKVKKRMRSTSRSSASESSLAEGTVEGDVGRQGPHASRSASHVGTVREGIGDGEK